MAHAHVVPVRLYAVVFATLLVLTGITTAVAFVDLGPMNDVIMLAIALTKALLVLLFFMHLRYSSRLTWLFAAAGAIWVGHIFLFTLGDYLTRPQVLP
jgi:cytochrome c oxidase subunit IV